MPPALNNKHPIDFHDQAFKPLFDKLQGNIVKGHGREFSANIFVRFTVEKEELRQLVRAIATQYVTRASAQLKQAERYSTLGIPGSLFGNLMLTRHAYAKLGHGAQLQQWFNDPPEDAAPVLPQKANFLSGMLEARGDLGDPAPKGPEQGEPLERAYAGDAIDALIILADDSEQFLMREARALLDRLEDRKQGEVLAFEVGRALRAASGEGIEHFGYVDGRSQPLFLASDFTGLQGGAVVPGTTTEAGVERGSTRYWNPQASLDLVLLKDPGTDDPDAFGSYFVFRKLEQNVLGFRMAEQHLATELGLRGSDRERAGAMAVGRFRDGTPLTLNEAGGGFPQKSNDFRFDGLDAELATPPGAPADRLALKCPFHAHIRKANPRQSVVGLNDSADAIKAAEDHDRGRRIARRGITYGIRTPSAPNQSALLEELPSGGVGLLFGCFQRSIMRQFAFMQKTWVNNANFKVPATGIDPLIGQGAAPPQHWRKEYGGEPGQAPPVNLGDLDLKASHPSDVDFSRFITFRGGEFFFAPSLTFLIGE